MTSDPHSATPLEPGGGGSASQPRPFADSASPPPGGCSRPLVIGCAGATVLLGVLLLVVLWKAADWMPAMFRWSLEQFETQVSANLPEELTEAERRRLDEAFELAVTAVEDGSADPAALQRLQGRLMDTARAGELSREQVLELAAALEAVAGKRAPPAESPPAPAPEPETESGGDSRPLAA